MYFNDVHIQRNIEKSIYYLTLAANQNNSAAQLYLGTIYFTGLCVEKNIYKGIDYINQAAKNNEISACFSMGYFYHEGKYIDRDIKKAIHFYKEASSFNDNYAKNNLGILYKNGFFDEIPKQLGDAEIYFNEAIVQKNDPVSMYNLAHMYLYEKSFDCFIDKSIRLLLNSIILCFYPSLDLLCIALVKKHGNNIIDITDELVNYSDTYGEIICHIITYIQHYKFTDPLVFKQKYERFEKIDFLYNFYLIEFPSNVFLNPKNEGEKNDELNINSVFYDGLGDI